MDKALFINNDTAELISAQQINSRTEYLSMYNGKLYCPTPGCTAQLSFAITPSFRHKKIFKTAKNSEHTDTCPHKILHDASVASHYSMGTINQALSDRHKRDILSKLYLRNTKPVENTPEMSNKQRPQKQRDTNSVGTPILVASISPDAESAKEGEREPSVLKRKSNDLSSEDINKLRAIDGYAISAKITQDYIEIWLTPTLSLLFFNAFRDSSNMAYQEVTKIAHDINNSKDSILVCCIGIIEDKTEYYQIQIMDPSLVTFNNESPFNYYSIA